MNILISAYTFYPHIGGIETFTDSLATHLVELGNEVTLFTPVCSQKKDTTPYRILRKPSVFQLIEAFDKCDVFYQSNMSLRLAWPLLLLPRPLFITHHIGLERADSGSTLPFSFLSLLKQGALALKNTIKEAFCKLGTCVVVSEFLNSCFSEPSFVIYNPYKDHLFYPRNAIPQSQSLVFVGRLVPEKGLHCALEALKILKDRNQTPHFYIIGQGPDQAKLEALVLSYDLEPTVHFCGPLEGEALAEAYCEHAIQLVPSVWEEPFGLVALEGIACGCVPIGSERGGLKEAIGPCGLSFPNGNARALADCIEDLLKHPEKQTIYRSHAKAHLAQFSSKSLSKRYLHLFQSKLDSHDALNSI